VRISLVNVQFHEGNNMFPPLGVLYVAGALREAGHRVQVLDGDPWFEADIEDRMVAFEPELIGLSFLTMTTTRAVDLARRLRERLPEVPQMAGGPHATVEPRQTLEALGVDVVVRGEGERTAVELAARFAAGDPIEGVAGACGRDWEGPPRAAIADLDGLPFPARDLSDFERYLSPPGLIRGWASSRHASMLASRGCRYRCTFCASHLQLGRTFRIRSVEDVLSEVDELVARYRIRGIYWVDDIFTGDKVWVRQFCEALARRPYRLEWGCQSRVESADVRTLSAMRDAGCVQVDYGVESGSKAVLRRMKKGTTWDSVVRAFDLTHEVGLRTGASFILGSPGETEADVRETMALAERIASDWTVFFFSTPYPGTELWHEVRSDARAAGFPSYGDAWNNRQRTSPFPLSEVQPERLAELRRDAQNRHFRANYLRRRNLRFAARLTKVAIQEPALLQQAAGVFLRGGRLDDAVEAWFAADRARVTLRRRGAPSGGRL